MMNDIPNDLIINIITFGNISSIGNILQTSNKFNNLKTINQINHIIKTYLEDVNNYKILLNNISPEFIEILKHKIFPKNYSKYRLLFNAKKIDIDSNTGSTGYIDFLRPNHFNSTNIIYGYDCYNRFFISIIYDKKVNNIVTTNNVITFFQRYSDNDYFYVNGGQSFYGTSVISNFNFNDKLKKMDMQFNVFFDLIIYGSAIGFFEEYNYEYRCNQIYKYEFNLSNY